MATARARFIEPMLLQLTTRLPEGAQWLYELKLDGYIFRTGLVAAVTQPFRRRTQDLPRLSMRATADRYPRVRGLSRLHCGGHSSKERRCDQGRPGYQSFTPARHSMDMLLIGIVTLIADGRFPL